MIKVDAGILLRSSKLFFVVSLYCKFVTSEGVLVPKLEPLYKLMNNFMCILDGTDSDELIVC